MAWQLAEQFSTDLPLIDLQAIKNEVGSADTLDPIIAVLSSHIASHPCHGELAKRLHVHQLHSNTPSLFSDAMRQLSEANLLDPDFYAAVIKNADQLDAAIVHERDLLLNFFGLKTLDNGYLMHINGTIIERPQYMFMRVALAIHVDSITDALESYELMSTKYFIHATPTLFNAGSKRQQMSSCYLMQIHDDSLRGIFKTLDTCGQVSKYAGGIGIAISNVRCKGSKIKSTNGKSSGIIPMLRMFNAAGRYVNQAGKRNGSIAVYLEPWHPDIMDFLQLRKNYGNEELRTRDLFIALWICDLFMERVEQDKDWCLMCPSECPGLMNSSGKVFEELYKKYEDEGRYIKKVPARLIWSRMMESQIETGTPYIMFKDSVNYKSNQQHMGTIQCGNLCTEITEFTSPDEVAVCNLASLGLPTFVSDGAFDHEGLHRVTKVVAHNLNKVIDRNYYPVEEARFSNMRHRPIGVGVQGLADVFAMLKIPFDSDEAVVLNTEIFETIYHAAMETSIELAKQHGPYEKYEGSPLSQGKFQFDLWGATPSSRWDWDVLRTDLAKHGARNSLLLAPMPTASTSQILGYNECFESYMSNIFKRKTLAGEFIVVNEHLVGELEKHDLWNRQVRDAIIAANGSIQGIEGIPEYLGDLFKTTWEIKQKRVIDMAAARGPFICQSQSMNLYMEDPDFKKISSMHFYAWKKGLKTGCYYLRARPRAQTQQFTIEPPKKGPTVKCSGDVCTMCSS